MGTRTGSLFVLSGEGTTLVAAETRALLEAYSPGAACAQLGGRMILSEVTDGVVIDRVTERASFCRFGGRYLGSASTLDGLSEYAKELNSEERSAPFAVASETLPKEVCGELGARIQAKTGAKVSLKEPELVLQVEQADAEMVLAASKKGRKTFAWRDRRPRARGFFLPSAIYPKLARALVNLSRAREGDVFLDPFCGTGSLLIESQLMGLRTVGFELVRWIARGARMNLRKYSTPSSLGIVRADSTFTHLPLTEVRAVATDVPYGRASSTKGKDTSRIIAECTEALADSMPRSCYCVIMHPAHSELPFERKAFELRETHFIYVHRNLTRAIAVLQRI